MVIKTKKKVKKMAQSLNTITARIDGELYSRMQSWLSENGLSTNQLLAKAVDKYISEEQTLKPVRIPKEDLNKGIDRVFNENGSTLDKLK